MPDRVSCTLVNAHGIQVELSNLGASIRRVWAPDAAGNLLNIAYYPDDPLDGSYAGATLAPYAGRQRNAQMTIGTRTFALSRNEGNHHIHGGFNNLSRALWEMSDVSNDSRAQSVRFTAQARDGLDGYPGNRRFDVVYTLDRADRLIVRLQAYSDRPTRVNLTNHTYWNLSGRFDRDAMSQLLCVHARRVYINDAQNLPVSCVPVEGTPFDFRTPRPVSAAARAGGAQLRIARGYNHAFILDPRTHDAPAAVLCDPGSGRRLRVYTDQPCALFYSGGYLPVPSCALALEMQQRPLLPGDAPDPATLLTPEVPYQRTIVFRFDTPEG